MEVGVIQTKRPKKRSYEGYDHLINSQEIAGKLLHLISCYKPVEIVAEAIAGSRSRAAAQLLGAAVGIVGAVSEATNTPIRIKQARAVKKITTGDDSASKVKVERAMCKNFPALRDKVKDSGVKKGSTEHIFDACSVYLSFILTDDAYLNPCTKLI